MNPACGVKGLTAARGGLLGQRPDLTPGRNSEANPPESADRTLLFDPAAFVSPPVGFLGNLGRNTLHGDGITSFDLVLMKNTSIPVISEDFNLQFRVEFFNVFNNVNFDIPSPARLTVFNAAGARTADAGRATATIVHSREIQFGLKIIF